MESLPVLTLVGTLEYECEGGVSPVLENGTARGKQIDAVDNVGPMAPTLLFCHADAGSRKPGEVVVFLDVHRQEDGTQPVANVSMRFWTSSENGEAPALQADARFCLQSYVSSVNKCGGVTCKEDCGQASVSLRWLHERWNARTSKASMRVEVPLRIHTLRDNRQVGTVWLTVTDVRNEGNAEFGPLRPYMNDERNLSHLTQLVDGYLRNYERENELFRAYVSGTEPINCPIFPGEVTVANSRVKLPVASFALCETPDVSPAYWRDALAVQADRQGFDSADAYADSYLTRSLEERCGLAGLLVFQYVQQFDYVADRTNAPGSTRMSLADSRSRAKENIEMFGDAIAVRCGDCEDLALALIQFLRAFCRHARFEGTDVQTRVLADQQRLLRQYVPHLAIEGVTCAAVTDARQGQTEVQGAHAALKLLPRDYHAECVARWNPTHPLATDRICCTVAPEYRGKLPVLVGEGTGLVDPWAAPDQCPASRELLDACAALEPAKKLLRPAFGTSPFYRAVIFSVCADYMQSHRTGTFRFAMPHRGGLGKGIRFGDLVRKSDKLRLIPFGFDAPLVPLVSANVGLAGTSVAGNVLDNGRDVCEFTGEMMLAMRSVCKTRLPCPAIRGATDAGKKPVDRAHHQLLHDFCDRINPDRTHRRGARVDAYLSLALASSQTLNAVAEHCSRFAGVYLAADYALQRMGSGLDVYRLSFYCDEEKAAAVVQALRN